ncbi:hypothetical protein HMPREF1231_0461 [Streptococcus pyogenes GA06023]|nr:hypothetical protein HMPREF1231_0461 [Streptococcus pyogenes GA06023]
MSDNTVAVEKIKKYLLDNKLKQVDLAVTYNKEPQDVANILAGRKKDPASNRFVLKSYFRFKNQIEEKYTNHLLNTILERNLMTDAEKQNYDALFINIF